MKTTHTFKRTTLRSRAAFLMAAVFTLAASLLPVMTARAAGCPAPSPDYGSATADITIPETATYRLWSRLKGPQTTSAYMLQVDSDACYVVGGQGVSSADWTWIDFQNGNAATKVEQSLTKGVHTLKFIGTQPDVKLDRVVAAADLGCIPTGAGDNCNDPTGGAPTVEFVAPAAGSTVSGVVNVSTKVTGTNITKVEFMVDAKAPVAGTANGSGYSFQWNTVGLTNETHVITAKVYDSLNRVGQASDYRLFVQNGDNQAPSVPGSPTATAPAYNKVNFNWNASTDNVAVTGYIVFRNEVPVKTVTGTTLTYADTLVLPNTAYGYQVQAVDAAGNKSALTGMANVTTPNIPDTQKPTTPTTLVGTPKGATQVGLMWNASTDNVAVVGYDIYRATGAGTPQKISSSIVTGLTFDDATVSPQTAYTYYVVARDAAGNVSANSNKVTVTTPKIYAAGTVYGVVRNAANSNKPTAQARVQVINQSTKQVTIIDNRSTGEYELSGLPDGSYTVMASKGSIGSTYIFSPTFPFTIDRATGKNTFKQDLILSSQG